MIDIRKETDSLKAAALKLGFVAPDEFDRIVDPTKMIKSYVATA